MSRRVLGIDPGSRITGYGVIECRTGGASYIASGCIQLAGSGAVKNPLPVRLGEIYTSVSELIEEYQPAEFAIEQVFMARNPQAALKLGQARGAAIAAGVAGGLPIYEYAARRVKQAVVGTGRANKTQVQHMVQVLLELSGVPQADAADALAIALCHAHEVRAKAE